MSLFDLLKSFCWCYVWVDRDIGSWECEQTSRLPRVGRIKSGTSTNPEQISVSALNFVSYQLFQAVEQYNFKKENIFLVTKVQNFAQRDCFIECIAETYVSYDQVLYHDSRNCSLYADKSNWWIALLFDLSFEKIKSIMYL